jgi:hypothetical protein
MRLRREEKRRGKAKNEKIEEIAPGTTRDQHPLAGVLDLT